MSCERGREVGGVRIGSRIRIRIGDWAKERVGLSPAVMINCRMGGRV